jgi:hypothetical protein
MKTGLSYKELRAKARRLNINTDGYMSKANTETLSSYTKDGFTIIPSKMNSTEKL